MLPISRRFENAVQLALRLHGHQTRKGNQIPYIAHLFTVAALAMEHGADEDEAIAALLHDAVEDAGGDTILRQIREQFGDRVAVIVEGCTDTDVMPKPPWRPRKEAFLARLRAADQSVRFVVACDKLHNARSLLSDLLADGPATLDRFTGGRDGTLWYYREVANVLREAGTGRLAAELDRVVREIEGLCGRA